MTHCPPVCRHRPAWPAAAAATAHLASLPPRPPAHTQPWLTMAGEAQWLDAQPYLGHLCAGMGVGELLHGPSFSLFDSTTAIEIGDPKMDMGMHRRRVLGWGWGLQGCCLEAALRSAMAVGGCSGYARKHDPCQWIGQPTHVPRLPRDMPAQPCNRTSAVAAAARRRAAQRS